ncbi:MAG: DUF1289 domain-containing protein [Gammaproteobacteria bacterium]|nr:DUF1289 domain-containing protein [Gammaproteobacteria bacterium]
MGDDGLCSGCFRTLEEIAVWGAMDNSWRSCVVSRLDCRRELARDRT